MPMILPRRLAALSPKIPVSTEIMSCLCLSPMRSILWMGVRVRVRAAPMRVRGGVDRDRNETHRSISDAALGDHAVGKLLDGRHLTAQHRDLQTAVVIEVNVQGRDLEVVVSV